jgi:competence protein ComEA
MDKTIKKGVFAFVVALVAAVFLVSAVPAVAGGYGHEKGKSASTEMAPEEKKANLNTAGVDDFSRYEGISRDLARAVVEYRDVNGPYSKWDDLLKVKGVSEKELSYFRQYFTIE